MTLAALPFFLLLRGATASPDGASTNNNQSHSINSTLKGTSPFKIVIDGGSTGSRLHIFELKQNPQKNKTYIERRGSTKVNIPLSNFASSSSATSDNQDDDNHAAYHLLPLFKFASDIIPTQYHATTHVSIQATAGMRLVDIENQSKLYDTIHEKLSNHKEFVFDSFRRSDINTLDGVLEGLYGVIAVNYLKGIVDVNLHYIEFENRIYHDYNDDSKISVDIDDKSNSEEQVCENLSTPFGALDLGGASMQIVFLPHPKSDQNYATESICPNTEFEEKKLPKHEFYSTSYLSYGSDQFRERLWDLWITEIQQGKRAEIEKEASKVFVENPCSFNGHETEWNGYILFGTGNAKECTNEINRLIPHHEKVDHSIEDEEEYIVGGIHHPEIRGEFYAMSLFFFVMDCVREYTQDEIILKEWPNPTLHELDLAVESFCSKHWEDDIIEIHGLDIHQFTKGHRLADRCFESVYIITLLRDGFGFDVHSRDITYSFLVDGSEVEWSLGMAVTLYAEDGKQRDASRFPSSDDSGESKSIDPHSNSEENSTNYEHRNSNSGKSVNEESESDTSDRDQIIGNRSILSEGSKI